MLTPVFQGREPRPGGPHLPSAPELCRSRFQSQDLDVEAESWPDTRRGRGARRPGPAPRRPRGPAPPTYLRQPVLPLLAHLLQLPQHAAEVHDAVLHAQPLVVLAVGSHQQLPHLLRVHLLLAGRRRGPGEQRRLEGQRLGSPRSRRPQGTWGAVLSALPERDTDMG